MDPAHQGDAYDPLKRFLMESLAPLSEWQILPMFRGAWADVDIERYATLLGVELFTTGVLTARSRAQQLRTDGWPGNAYLDPTTGVKRPTEGNQNAATHIRIDELARLVCERPESLTVVYDQSKLRGESKREALQDKLRQLRTSGIEGFGLDMQAPHLVLSCDGSVIEEARNNLLGAGIPPHRIVPLE